MLPHPLATQAEVGMLVLAARFDGPVCAYVTVQALTPYLGFEVRTVRKWIDAGPCPPTGFPQFSFPGGFAPRMRSRSSTGLAFRCRREIAHVQRRSGQP